MLNITVQLITFQPILTIQGGHRFHVFDDMTPFGQLEVQISECPVGVFSWGGGAFLLRG